MRPAAVGRHRDGTESAGEQRDPVGLDQRVDHECAPRLPLTIAAVATMDEHRRASEPIPHCAAGATALQITLVAFHRMTS